MTMHAIKNEKDITELNEQIDRSFEGLMSESADNNMTMEQRFDSLAQQLISLSFMIMDRQRIHKTRMTEDEKAFLDDGIYQLNLIEKVFGKLRKQGRLPQSALVPNQDFDKQLIQQIAERKSSMSNIVQQLPPVKNDGTGTPK